MSNQREEEIWDEAYLYGLRSGKQAGLEIAQKQMEKVFKEAYNILNVELRLVKENRMANVFKNELHDPYRGMD